MAAREFPRFPELPTELRLLIWSHCVPGPQVFEMDIPLSDNHLSLPVGGAQRCTQASSIRHSRHGADGRRRHAVPAVDRRLEGELANPVP